MQQRRIIVCNGCTTAKNNRRTRSALRTNGHRSTTRSIFATGRSGLVLDAVVEDGNPAGHRVAACRCCGVMSSITARRRRRAAFDGGYASRGNLKEAKDLGVAHVVFNKKRGIKVADMTASSWLYARLKRFRAGIEAGISYLKPSASASAAGAACRASRPTCSRRCVAHNLLRIVRLLPRADLTPPVARRRGPVRKTGGRPLPVRFETAVCPAERARESARGGRDGPGSIRDRPFFVARRGV